MKEGRRMFSCSSGETSCEDDYNLQFSVVKNHDIMKMHRDSYIIGQDLKGYSVYRKSDGSLIAEEISPLAVGNMFALIDVGRFPEPIKCIQCRNPNFDGVCTCKYYELGP